MINTLSPKSIEHAAKLIAQADALIVAAGAGIGVDSGLPDFRGNEGFWKAYPALAKAKLDFMDVASPRTFVENPALAWGFYGHRLALYRKTTPHAGFQILRKWVDRIALGGHVFTSNVDGQFQKAGFSPERMHECHGSIHHLQCMTPCTSAVWSADDFVPEVDEDNCLLLNAPPTCPHCGGLARPNILMFGDWDWLTGREDAQRRLESNWLDTLAQSHCSVVVIEMGAGTAIPSVRSFSHRISKDYGARIIRINPTEPQVPSSQDIGMVTGALEALQGIDAALELLLGSAKQNCTEKHMITASSKTEPIPTEVYELILRLSKQPDICSISCPFQDYALWQALIAEQVRRSVELGVAPQKALRLNGPDSGIPGVQTFEHRKDLEWGGEVHIPYEGATGGDLFIQPNWFGFSPDEARTAPTLSQAVFGDYALDGYKTCKYLLTRWKKLGDLQCATKTEVGDWVLYTSRDKHTT